MTPVPAIRALLAPGEEVLWSGRPRQTTAAAPLPGKRLATVGGAVMAAAVLYLILFAAPASSMKNLPGLVLLAGLLLAALGGFLRARAWLRRDLRARTSYVLTRRRAYRYVEGISEPPEVWDLGPGEPAPVLAVGGDGDWALLFQSAPDPAMTDAVTGDGFKALCPDLALLARLRDFGITGAPALRYVSAPQ